MEAIVQIDGKNYHFGNPQNDISINEITRNNKNLKSIFAYFDKNKDNKLSAKEIEQAFKVFTSLDNTLGKRNGELTDAEIKNGLNIFSEDLEITIADYKNFIKSLASTNNGMKLAGDLYNQIKGPSLNSKTRALLSKINATNVLEVLKQYEKKSPKESLAYAIDNEWGLDIKDVKTHICSPLVMRAKILNIKNINHKQYQNIKNIDDLNNFIINTTKRIKAEEIRIAKLDSIAPIKRNPQYKKVYKMVEYQLTKRIPTNKPNGYTKISEIPKKEQAIFIKRAENITRMVIEKCQKYDIEELSSVVAEVLGIEYGGYNFTDKFMKEKEGYKGDLKSVV